MRQAPGSFVGWLWVAFALLWLILAQFNKRGSRNTPWRAAWGVRLAVIAGVLIIMSVRGHAAAGAAWLSHSMALHTGRVEQWLGLGLCVLGFGFAIWARGYLGRNWGMPMSLRQGHELVTSGPYAYVRHPIYTGIMVAMIGSALAVDPVWLAIFVLCVGYFLLSARVEEKMMLAQFPDAYPAYRRRTRMLIPFLL